MHFGGFLRFYYIFTRVCVCKDVYLSLLYIYIYTLLRGTMYTAGYPRTSARKPPARARAPYCFAAIEIIRVKWLALHMCLS